MKALRKEYEPRFDSKSFELKRPKLDRTIKRRLKRVRSQEAARASAKEKNLANLQFKILDVFRPLLYAWALICSGDAGEEHPLNSAVVCSIKLLGHCFHHLSAQRRANISKVTDPEYVDVANESDLFDPRESADLSGRKFLRNLAREVQDDNTGKRHWAVQAHHVIRRVEIATEITEGVTVAAAFSSARAIQDLTRTLLDLSAITAG